MNTSRLYWAGRLNEGEVFWWKPPAPGVHYRGRWPWPKYVSRKSLYDDYVTWFCEDFRWVNYLTMAERKSADPVDIETFFDCLKPYLHYGNQAATTFPVKIPVRFDGQWVMTDVRRKFIRLMDLEDAIAHFKMITRGLTTE